MRIVQTVLIICVLSLCCTNNLNASDYVELKIVLEKTKYVEGEPIKGHVVVTGNLPATFRTRLNSQLYHNDQFFNQFHVLVPIFMGDTEYPLKTFGVTGFELMKNTVGQWRIVIDAGGDPPITAENIFNIYQIHAQPSQNERDASR